jgi:hypothetical protein
MKQFILFFTFIISSLIYQQANAQCSISDLKVRLIEVNNITCEVTFDLSWTQEVNSGNKFAYIHMWAQPSYHTPAANWSNMYSNPAAYPKAADLINSLATIVIDDNHADNPLIGSVYHPDPMNVVPQQSFLSIVKVHLNNTLVERMTVRNIKLRLSSCAGAQTLMFDIWASQGQNGKNVHCASQGANLVLNEVRPVGTIVCTTPRQFQVFIQNTGPALDGVQYDVHLDNAPFGILNPTDTIVFVSEIISLPANGFYTSPVTGYLPYSNRDPASGLPLIVEVSVPLRPNTTTATMENGCGPLPVKFISFTAQQLSKKVMLNWQTANEQNNRGFEVQRKLPGEDFRTIAFVPARSFNGNSSLITNYVFEDAGILPRAIQVFYRLTQVDQDGKARLSEVRLVNYNPETMETLIYPNPARGLARVILPTGIGPVEIVLQDVNGKEVSRWSGVTDQLLMDNLNAGVYLLRIIVSKTGNVEVHKILVL